MKIIKEDSFILVIDEKGKYVYAYEFENLLHFIHNNSIKFRNLPNYEFELFNNKYNSISKEAIIKSLFENISSMKDQEECEFNIFDEYTFKLKVVRMK